MNGEFAFTERRGAPPEKILKGENRPAHAENDQEMRAEKLTPAVLCQPKSRKPYPQRGPKRPKGSRTKTMSFLTRVTKKRTRSEAIQFGGSQESIVCGPKAEDQADNAST